jgi:predicted nucleic acid-binding protein
MRRHVFLDASFWITYRDEKEGRQPAATRTVAELFRQRCDFVTTLPVICEIHATFARNRRKRDQVLSDLYDNPVVTVENILPEDQNAAFQLLRANRDKTYPLCDAISFAVMRRLRISQVATFDSHFRQFGEFEILPGEFGK